MGLYKFRLIILNKIIIVSISLLVSQVVYAIKPYVPSGKVDAATLTIKNNASRKIELKSFSDPGECTGDLLEVSEDGIPVNGSVKIKIDPSKEFTFLVGYLFDHKLCRIPATFQPQSNANYEIIFSADEYNCYLPMSKVENGGSVPEKTYRVRQWLTLAFANDSCE